MGRLTFLLGGARSGKSAYAQKVAERSGKSVTFIATGQAGDDEMTARIAKHRAERPAHWLTLEIPYGIARVLKENLPDTEMILLDCATLLVSNLLLLGQSDLDHPDEASASARVEAEVTELLAFIRENEQFWIIVSNEVGLGLVPEYPLGRLYRDLLGHTNQRLAGQADEVLWIVAGIPIPIQAFRASF